MWRGTTDGLARVAPAARDRATASRAAIATEEGGWETRALTRWRARRCVTVRVWAAQRERERETVCLRALCVCACVCVCVWCVCEWILTRRLEQVVRRAIYKGTSLFACFGACLSGEDIVNDAPLASHTKRRARLRRDGGRGVWTTDGACGGRRAGRAPAPTRTPPPSRRGGSDESPLIPADRRREPPPALDPSLLRPRPIGGASRLPPA